MPVQDIGTGTTITFATSFFSAQVLSVSHSQSRESVDISNMDTTGDKTFMPVDLTDPGEITVEMLFDPASEPPIDDAAETIRITFPLRSGDISAAYWEASGFMTSFEYTDPLEDKMTATATIKLSGTVTFQDAV